MELRSAILSGEIAEVGRSLCNGAAINTETDAIAPLTFAIQNGEEDIAEYLMQEGADLSLEPLPSVSEERKLTKNIQVDTLNVMLALIVIWFEESSRDAACASVLTRKLWPSFLGPILNSVSAQTLFGFTMRGFVIELCFALTWRNFNTSLRFHARSMPTYLVLFLWVWTDNRPGPVFDSSGGLRWMSQHCFLVGKWILLRSAFLVIQEILYVCINHLHLLPREGRSGARSPCHGGSQALEAVLSSPSSSHKVASAIIDSKVFSREHIKCSIQLAMRSYDPLVLRLWT